MTTYLNTHDMLDSLQTRIPDKSTATRANMLAWLNDAMRAVVNEPREWEFLKKTASLTITDSRITLPDDFGRVISIQIGSEFCFTQSDELTEKQAFDVTNGIYPNYAGYLCDLTYITFYGSFTGTTAVLTYLIQMNADYADVATATIFPIEFGLLLKRSVMSVYKEGNEEPSATLSVQLDAKELRTMKILDNRKKGTP